MITRHISKYLPYLIYLDTWRCRHLCDGWRAMLAHRSRSTARLVQSRAGRPAHSLTSPTQLFRGRPLGRLPFTLPSIVVVKRLFLLLTWPKYLSFLCWIFFKSCLDVFSFLRTVSLLMWSFHLIFPIWRKHHISKTSILLSLALDHKKMKRALIIG